MSGYRSGPAVSGCGEPRYLYLLGQLGELASAVPVRGMVG